MIGSKIVDTSKGVYGHVDSIDSRGISGWILDLDNGVNAVEVYINGVKVAEKEANLPRVDIDKIVGFVTNCGFFISWREVKLTINLIKEKFYLQVIHSRTKKELTGNYHEFSTTEIGERDIGPKIINKTQGIYGFVDVVSKDGISGWLLDLNSTVGEHIELIINGVKILNITPKIYRHDISLIIGKDIECGFHITPIDIAKALASSISQKYIDDLIRERWFIELTYAGRKIKINKKIEYNDINLLKQSVSDMVSFLFNNNQVEIQNASTSDDLSIFYIIQAPNLIASNIYRVFNNVELLSDKGIRCNFCYESDIGRNLDLILSHEIIVLYRCGMNESIKFLIDVARKRGNIILFDTDDYIFDPDIASEEYIDGLRFLSDEERKACLSGFKKYRDTLMLCDAATTTTNFMKFVIESKFRKKTYVLKNYLNKKYIDKCSELLSRSENLISKKTKITIGYFAGTKTHQRDLKVASNAISDILKEFSNVEFLVSDQVEIEEFPELKKIPEKIKKFSSVDYYDLPEVINRADICIAPLEIFNPFTQSKSEVKFIECAAMKKPLVASATETYKEIINDGYNGYLAEDEKDWYLKLKKLVVNEEERQNIGKKAYDFVLKNYYIDISLNLINTYKEIRDLLKTRKRRYL